MKLSALALGLILCIYFISCMCDKTKCAHGNFIYYTSSGAVLGMWMLALQFKEIWNTLRTKPELKYRTFLTLQEGEKKPPRKAYTWGQGNVCPSPAEKDQWMLWVLNSTQFTSMVLWWGKWKDKPTYSKRTGKLQYFVEGPNIEHFAWFCTPCTSKGEQCIWGVFSKNY